MSFLTHFRGTAVDVVTLDFTLNAGAHPTDGTMDGWGRAPDPVAGSVVTPLTTPDYHPGIPSLGPTFKLLSMFSSWTQVTLRIECPTDSSPFFHKLHINDAVLLESMASISGFGTTTRQYVWTPGSRTITTGFAHTCKFIRVD